MILIDRERLLATLRGALEAHPEVEAAWEGGSAAFSYRDELSDVDAVVVVADEAVEAVFAAVEVALNALSPIALRHDVTGTPGFSQRFYRLRDASEFLVVDLVLIRRSDPLLFRDVELHGQGQTWVDRRGLLQPSHLDAAADREQARARIPVLRSAFDMFQHIPTKERLRGRKVEALQFYQGMTLRPLVEALRLLHCPQRRIFGLRYLARDLPAEVVARIEQLMFVADLPDLERKHEQAQQWFWETMARLERDGPGAADDGSAQN
ncbi:MAG: nucleotidyltransferase domain-containing protein [Burkholderiaceae bacterium]|nr:nucleotidyltransferase domain-containing protein [Burkholderiaceae bacterium]